MTNHPNRSWRARMAAIAEDLGPDLVTAWVHVRAQREETRTQMAAELSRVSGRTIELTKLARWQRGAESVPWHIQSIMRADVLEYLTQDQLLAIILVARLEPPPAAR